MQPLELEWIRSLGRVSDMYFSLLDLDLASVPEGRYRFPRVNFPTSKMSILPSVSHTMFSADRSDLIRLAVPYFVGLLLEIML